MAKELSTLCCRACGRKIGEGRFTGTVQLVCRRCRTVNVYMSGGVVLVGPVLVRTG